MTPTQKWLSAIEDLPPLTGPANTAERLLLLLHYGIDWQNGWLATRRDRYWDHHLPSRIRVATYRCGPDLDRWWTIAATSLDSAPRNAGERREITELLRQPPRPVLTVLRESTTALVLRTQIVAAEYRASKQTG